MEEANDLPMQPIVMAPDGVIRFRENRAVSALLAHSQKHGFGLNELAIMDINPADHAQLAQLIGYSVSGFGDLSHAPPEQVERADAIAEDILKARAQSTPTVGKEG